MLCWTQDTGYSSGATSPLYALVLGLGYLVGFHGALLGWFAAAVAYFSLFDLTTSITRLSGPRVWVGVVACLLALGVPLLDWTFASGMEAAFVSAVIVRAVVAVSAATRAAPHVRDRAQLRAGVWLAAVAMGRPECVPLALALGIVVAHGAGSRPLLPTLARALAPTVLSVAGFALLNLAFTGEITASGAVRKLITHDPYASPADAALLVAVNALRLYTVGIEVALGGPWAARALFALALLAVVLRSTRRIAAALVAGALAAFLLVTLNKTAPFQNLRYLAPTLLLLLLAAGLGVRAAAHRSRALGFVAASTAIFIVGSASRELVVQRDHFARAARNIREQQVEVGLRIASMQPPPRRVFVGDAGAIPYMTDTGALDGLGLGGYRDLPFAEASVHGVGSVVELIERLAPEDRPDVLAIYDGWWPGLGEHFGRRAFSVRIEDNVICADPEKVVYRADWSLLEDRAALSRGARFRIDVADRVDEAEFDVDFTKPRGGYVSATVLTDEQGTPRYDAQRLLAEAQWLSFVVPDLAANQRTLRIVLTTDSPPGTRVRAERAGRPDIEAEVEPREAGAWGRAELTLPDVIGSERVRVVAASAALRIGAIAARD